MPKPTKQVADSSKTGFLEFISKSPIVVVSLIPILLVIVLAVIWEVIKSGLFPTMPPIYDDFFVSVVALIMGFVGIVYIYRKEMPGPVFSATIKGSCAIATGYVLLLFFWLLGIARIIFSLFESR